MKTVLLILSVMVFTAGTAQDTTEVQPKWFLQGYIKNMESLSFDKNFRNIISGNLLHNRLNIKWKPAEKITVTAEFRNRLTWGEEVRSIPGYARLLRNDNEKLNLQKAWVQNEALVLHSNTERLNIEYRRAKWNMRLGRQRINWGLTTTWNPNDIFNTYNFLDFDYEERPGVDGAKLQYIFTGAAHAELVYANTGTPKGNVAAVKYNLNKEGYDWQFIGGWYKEHLTAGVGWAGSIGDAGFKGELQYFVRNSDSAGHFNAALEADYMFKKGWYLQGGLLFNNNGLSRAVSDWNNISLKIAPENLMPTKWNMIITTAKEITPLLSVRASVLYAPGTNLLIWLPALRYNLATNLDADLVWQSFFAELENHFEAVNHRGFLRLKWSF